MIRAAVGFSSEPNAARAALEAGSEILRRLGGNPPAWCVAFLTSDHEPHVQALLATLAEAIGTPYVVGCSAAGVLGPGVELESGPALGALAVSSGSLAATPFLFRDSGDRGRTAALQLGRRMLASRESDDVVVALADPYHVRPDHLLQGLHSVIGPVPVVGSAAAGGDGESTFQFCGSEVARDAVAGLRLGGRFGHAIGVTQGSRPIAGPFQVTRAHENLLLELDGRPALDRVREQATSLLDTDPRGAIDSVCIGLLPEGGGAAVELGAYLIRNITAIDADTGLLAIGDRVEEGQSVIVAIRDAWSAEQDMRAMLGRAREASRGFCPAFGLYFNCVARGRSLYGTPGRDSAMVADAFPGLPWLGLFGNAEFGPLGGTNRLFTYAGVWLVVGEPRS